jgi:protein-disulfide isomerase-like protein with CxxC motif
MTLPSPSDLSPSGLSLDLSVQSDLASPSSPVLNEEQLLDAVMQASALQQQGNTGEAIAIYRQIYQSDPDGQMGMVAQKALESMGVEVAEVTTVEPIALYESAIEAQPQSRSRCWDWSAWGRC